MKSLAKARHQAWRQRAEERRRWRPDGAAKGGDNHPAWLTLRNNRRAIRGRSAQTSAARAIAKRATARNGKIARLADLRRRNASKLDALLSGDKRNSLGKQRRLHPPRAGGGGMSEGRAASRQHACRKREEKSRTPPRLGRTAPSRRQRHRAASNALACFMLRDRRGKTSNRWHRAFARIKPPQITPRRRCAVTPPPARRTCTRRCRRGAERWWGAQQRRAARIAARMWKTLAAAQRQARRRIAGGIENIDAATRQHHAGFARRWWRKSGFGGVHRGGERSALCMAARKGRRGQAVSREGVCLLARRKRWQHGNMASNDRCSKKKPAAL